jgi:hypothetical protein
MGVLHLLSFQTPININNINIFYHIFILKWFTETKIIQNDKVNKFIEHLQ